jgi:hypothetical protein
MAPSWLTVLAWLYLAICFCCAGIIAYDIIVNRRRQPMGVMNFVFPITALYFGPLAVALYWRWGRAARAAAPAMATTAAMSMTSMTSTGDSARQHAMATWPEQVRDSQPSRPGRGGSPWRSR